MRPRETRFFPVWFLGWQKGYRAGFNRAWVWIAREMTPVMYFSILWELNRRRGKSSPEANKYKPHELDPEADRINNAASAETIEEVDLNISGGRFLLLGKLALLTNRRLGPRARIKWNSQKEFIKYVRTIWWNRALTRIIQSCRKAGESIPIATEGESVGISEEDLSCAAHSCRPRRRAESTNSLESHDRMVATVQRLYWESEHPSFSPRTREIARKTAAYIKQNVALCSPEWKDTAVKEIIVQPIRLLLQGADLGRFKFERELWRQFLMDELNLNRDVLKVSIYNRRCELKKCDRALHNLDRELRDRDIKGW